jgi:hypothetical protein
VEAITSFLQTIRQTKLIYSQKKEREGGLLRGNAWFENVLCNTEILQISFVHYILRLEETIGVLLRFTAFFPIKKSPPLYSFTFVTKGKKG